MDLERETSPMPDEQTLAPTDLSGYGQRCTEAIPQEGHREDQVPQVPQHVILSPQKGLIGTEDHSRPLQTERIHQENIVQNANLETSETHSPYGSLDCLTRSQGRVLAPVGGQSLQTFSGVPIQRTELEVQGNALRAQHSTENIYQADSIHSPMPDKGGYMVPSLLRRSPHHSTFQGGVSNETSQSHGNSPETRVDYQPGEVQNEATAGIRMAGHTLQFGQLYCEQHRHTMSAIPLSTHGDYGEGDVHKTSYHASPGTSKLAGSSRPPTQISPLPHQSVTEEPQKSPLGYKATSGQQTEINDREVDVSPEYHTTVGTPRANIYSPIGRLPDGFWLQNKPKLVPRNVRQDNGTVLHQCLGTIHNLAGNSNDPREKSSNKNSVRQLNGPCINQQSILNDLPTCRDSRNDMETGSIHELDYISCPHKRDIQCDRRPAVTQHSHLNRMVSPCEDFQTRDTQARTKTPSGLVCHESQPSAGDLHLPVPRPESNCSRCHGDGLEQVESPVPLPSTSFGFEGFTKAETVKNKNRIIRHQRRTFKALVRTTEITSYALTNSSSETTTDCRANPTEREEDFQNSRVEVLKVANNAQFPNCDQQTISLITGPIRKSSEADYQRKWKFFLEFVSGKGIEFEDIKIDIVLRFFSYLFYTKGLKPSTVAHYRSALSQPLLDYFNIDLKVKAVNAMLRAMRIQRPHEPTPRPAWKLSKALTHLESLNTDSLANSLRKTAFLLLLATGWRISEIHACVRNEDYCNFTGR